MTVTHQGGAEVPGSVGKLARTLIDIAGAHSRNHSIAGLLNEGVGIIRSSLTEGAVFVHLWDSDSQSLVLRAATDGDQSSHLNVFALRVGEGVVGWVALTGKVAMINDDPARDARYKYFPQVNEDAFRSGIAVPLRHQAGTLGVISAWSTQENAYTWTDVEFLSGAAELLASLVSATTATQHRSARAVVLGAIIETFTEAPRDSHHEVLDRMASLLLHHLASECCLIVLNDADGVSSLGGCAPSGHELREKAQYVVAKGDPRLLAEQSGPAAPFAAPFSTAMSAQFSSRHPAGHGSIWCYRSAAYTREETATLDEVAALLGLVIGPRIAHNAEYAEARERLFQLLAASGSNSKVLEQASALGINPNHKYCALAARITLDSFDYAESQDPEAALARVSAAVESFMRGLMHARHKSIVERLGNTVQALIPLAPGHSTAQTAQMCQAIAQQLQQRLEVRIDVGIGGAASAAAGLSASLREAREALNYVTEEATAPRVIEFSSAVPSIYFSQMAKSLDVGRLPYVRQLEALLVHDEQRKSRFVHTLGRFLAAAGNASVAAEQLHIHRNTMRQRLARIEQLTLIPVQSMTPEELFEVRVALMLCEHASQTRQG